MQVTVSYIYNDTKLGERNFLLVSMETKSLAGYPSRVYKFHLE